MKERIKNWIKKTLGITAIENENRLLLADLRRHEMFVERKVAELKKYTRVDADIGMRGNNTIILTGVYRNQAYVRFYDIGDGEFRGLIEQMKNMKDHCLIRNVDAPPNFRGAFKI